MDKIPIDQIKGLNQVFLGRKKYFRIKEWKTRDLLSKNRNTPNCIPCLQKMEF
jgi:hypothetical protein